MPSPFAALARHKTMLLTTYRRDGRAVATPVNVAVEDGRAFFRTYESSGKVKRLRANPHVALAASTFSGKPIGPTIRARAVRLEGAAEETARRAIEHRLRVLQGLIVPLYHRMMKLKTVHFEVLPASE